MPTDILRRPAAPIRGSRAQNRLALVLLAVLAAYALYTMALLMKSQIRGEAPSDPARPWPGLLEHP
jgi:hypothetical protein